MDYLDGFGPTYILPEVFITASRSGSDTQSGTTQSDNSNFGMSSKFAYDNYILRSSAIGSGFENLKLHSFRIFKPNGNFAPKLYNSGWGIIRASGTTKVYALTGLGKSLGNFAFGIGVANDLIGMKIYHTNPNSPWAVPPKKGITNIGVSTFSLYNPTAGLVYFPFEIFHPGGFRGASEAATSADVRMMKYTWFNYFNKQ